MESVHNVLTILNATTGAPLLQGGALNFNTFYDYPPMFVQGSQFDTLGPFLFDPQCVFEQDTQRWFHIVFYVGTFPQSSGTVFFTGPTSLEVAVSDTADPTGEFHSNNVVATCTQPLRTPHSD
jgi:hypothetical protein